MKEGKTETLTINLKLWQNHSGETTPLYCIYPFL